MKRLNPAARHAWIKAYLHERPGYDAHVDVLDKAFVDAYLDATHAPYFPAPYGAHKCAQLGRDLAAMQRLGELTRARVGLGAGSRNEGFPAWIYSYHLKADAAEVAA